MYKNSFLEKSLVCVILLIIIGLGVPSSTSGYFGIIRTRSVEEVSTTFLLNNDYVLAYWKFDEGSGIVLQDSSGNNLDGTINGAKWTTGYSGYALDFDGVDDYVALDTYSTTLGINKTDDLIFSVYFNSTLNDSGMIYCMAGTNHVPEVRIELLSNGTLLFKAWTTQCGISVYSDNTFNDGSWHNATIFFNGITANPNVKLYVDGNLEGNVTEWLCPILYSDFKKVKIGRRAYSEEAYFNGLIDELKIIKYPEGNQQPNPPDISGPTVGDPHVEYEFTFITNDLEEDNLWLWINWSDGEYEEWIGPYESGKEVIVSHEWDEEGAYPVTAKAKDIWDDSRLSEPHIIRIGNQPPSPPEISGPQFGDAGEELTYTFVAEDFEGEDVYYNVSWGDGTFDDWFGPYASGEEATAAHAWDTEDYYEITAKAMDTNGSEGDWSDPYPIRIGDEPPSAPQITGETNGGAGVDYNYTFKSIDPEGDKVYYWIEWFEDDPSAKWEGPYASGKEILRNHTWYEMGKYTIRAKAKDVFGAEGPWGTLKVTMPITVSQQSTKPLFFQFLQRIIQNLK
jgi:hypothetical protein